MGAQEGCLCKVCGGGFLRCVAKPQRKCIGACLNVKCLIKHFAESKL